MIERDCGELDFRMEIRRCASRTVKLEGDRFARGVDLLRSEPAGRDVDEGVRRRARSAGRASTPGFEGMALDPLGSLFGGSDTLSWGRASCEAGHHRLNDATRIWTEARSAYAIRSAMVEQACIWSTAAALAI